MEKLLDAPRLYEDAKRRYILALEAQRKSQTLIISNAQRKLVHNFQQKLKASATITKQHEAWRNETDIARHGYQRKCKERDRTTNIDGLQVKANVERPLLKNEALKSKRRPKTTGATANKSSKNIEKELTESLLHPPGNTGNEFVLKDFEHSTSEVNEEIKAMIGQSESCFASKKSCGIDFQGTQEESEKLSREFLVSDLDSDKIFSKWKVDSYTNMPKSNGMLRKGKDYCKEYVNMQTQGHAVVREEQFSYFGTGHLERCKFIAPQVATNAFSKMIATSEEERHVNKYARNIKREERIRSFKLDGQCRKDSGKTEACSGFSKSCGCDGDEDGWKMHNNGTRSTGSHSETSNTLRSLSLKQPLTEKKRSQTAANVKINSHNETKVHLKHKGKALSHAESIVCSQGSEELRRDKMSYEMRTWIYDIRRDVKRAQCFESDENDDSKAFQKAESSQTSLTIEESTDSSSALNKFEAIFNNIRINDHDCNDEWNIGPVEKLDTAALYSKSAVAGSKKRTKKAWKLRDPRNQKLQPKIIL